MSIAISPLSQINVMLHSECALIHSYVKHETRKKYVYVYSTEFDIKKLIVKTLILLSIQLHNILKGISN